MADKTEDRSQVKAAGRRRMTAATAAERMADSQRVKERMGKQAAEGGNPPTPRRGYGGQGKRRREGVRSKESG
jgi:hypothetical protein